MNEVYVKSVGFAKEHGEMERWKLSMRENVACKNLIEQTLREKFDGMYIEVNAQKGVLDRFGRHRTEFILAVTIHQKSWDGRFSDENKRWAENVLPENCSTELFDQYMVETHPAVLDGFVYMVRESPSERESVDQGIFELYQLGGKECGYRFMGTKFTNNMGLKIDRADYEKVYEGELTASDNLDRIYERFNINRPDDFFGHSLSVSDVIVLNNEEGRKAFYVDTFGFTELPDFFRSQQQSEIDDTADSILSHISSSRNSTDRKQTQHPKKQRAKEAVSL